tara:strand:- start:2436 stop:2789 length:354 start_codon:yes stop_codon:yes gene_type:complete
MLSNEELEETIILNALLTQRIRRIDELQDELIRHGGITISMKYVTKLLSSLENSFKSLNIKLLHAGAMFTSIYRVTDEAKEYAVTKLVTAIYDEEGRMESCYYQHPIVLGKERRMLI